ncbi:hypothetical protein [Seonamhaeicola sp.]|uniref:hypothetical protein n=1 Tax=Seonamhaeicola sp. TaxID=1912245 RepID=UPI00260898CA|nr:hypothetical protein [Seonamhaeicola sp.]
MKRDGLINTETEIKALLYLIDCLNDKKVIDIHEAIVKMNDSLSKKTIKEIKNFEYSPKNFNINSIDKVTKVHNRNTLNFKKFYDDNETQIEEFYKKEFNIKGEKKDKAKKEDFFEAHRRYKTGNGTYKFLSTTKNHTPPKCAFKSQIKKTKITVRIPQINHLKGVSSIWEMLLKILQNGLNIEIETEIRNGDERGMITTGASIIGTFSTDIPNIIEDLTVKIIHQIELSDLNTGKGIKHKLCDGNATILENNTGTTILIKKS